MLFKKYNFVIFREREGIARQLRVRGWLFVVALLLLFGFAASTAYLWNFKVKSDYLEAQILYSSKTIQEQNSQISSMAGKLQSLQSDIVRVQHFDSKLRVMMNLDTDPRDTNTDSNGANASTSQNMPLYRQELLSRHVHSLLEQLSVDTRLEEMRQQELLFSMRTNKELLISTPSIWPTEGILTSTFGQRLSPFGTGTSNFHQGIDIANRVGTPVRAPAKGVISSAEWESGYGNCVIINHGNNISTRYAHMQEVSAKPGQVVKRGDIIGTLGSTGRSTGPHLHYEVRIGGVCVNPMRYILN